MLSHQAGINYIQICFTNSNFQHLLSTESLSLLDNFSLSLSLSLSVEPGQVCYGRNLAPIRPSDSLPCGPRVLLCISISGRWGIRCSPSTVQAFQLHGGAHILISHLATRRTLRKVKARWPFAPPILAMWCGWCILMCKSCRWILFNASLPKPSLSLHFPLHVQFCLAEQSLHGGLSCGLSTRSTCNFLWDTKWYTMLSDAMGCYKVLHDDVRCWYMMMWLYVILRW